MSVGTFAFAVDLDRLRAVFGSKDRELASILESKCEDHIAEYEKDNDGDGRLRSALKDILEGEIRHPERAEFYVWATELLCHHLGTELELGEVGWPDDLELGTIGLENSGPPLPIPRYDDSPLLGFLTAEQVVEQYERLKGEDLSHEDEDVEEGRRALLSWLRDAAGRGQALVTLTQG